MSSPKNPNDYSECSHLRRCIPAARFLLASPFTVQSVPYLLCSIPGFDPPCEENLKAKKLEFKHALFLLALSIATHAVLYVVVNDEVQLLLCKAIVSA